MGKCPKEKISHFLNCSTGETLWNRKYIFLGMHISYPVKLNGIDVLMKKTLKMSLKSLEYGPFPPLTHNPDLNELKMGISYDIVVFQ